MKKILKWLDNYLEEAILSTLLAVMTCIMFLQICLRFLFHNTLIWPEELARDCFIYTAFFCIPLCIRRNTLLKVDIIVDFLPKKIKTVVLYLGDIVTFLIFGFLWINSWDVLTNSLSTPGVSQTMGFDLTWIYGMPFVALALGMFRSLQHLVRTGRGLRAATATQETEGTK